MSPRLREGGGSAQVVHQLLRGSTQKSKKHRPCQTRTGKRLRQWTQPPERLPSTTEKEGAQHWSTGAGGLWSKGMRRGTKDTVNTRREWHPEPFKSAGGVQNQGKKEKGGIKNEKGRDTPRDKRSNRHELISLGGLVTGP